MKVMNSKQSLLKKKGYDPAKHEFEIIRRIRRALNEDNGNNARIFIRDICT